MERKGTAVLPLHYGHPPEYLYKRMITLGGYISDLIIERFGVDELLQKLSDPFWFHSMSLAIGFDWNSSGTTTTTLSALKEYYSSHLSSVRILGGKGQSMSFIGHELDKLVSDGFLAEGTAMGIREKAKRIARIDENLLQDGYDLYLQFLVIHDSGKWVIIQQGLNSGLRMARRYHWHHRTSGNLIDDGRNGISAEFVHDSVLDLSTRVSEPNRKSMVEITRERPESLIQYANPKGLPRGQSTLDGSRPLGKVLNMDVRINWKKLREIYEYEPADFESLMNFKGAGKSTLRALSYLAEVVYGDTPSFRDPVKFSFAVGGKDGIPKPVNTFDYDAAIGFFREALSGTEMQREALNRLMRSMARYSYSRSSVS
ncbi:DUF763 domain-containing protein [Thermoplasmatales archaeon AK]|nr:DUF763 domain-containing protein [Thermoplasmatales archaeon AK]